MEGKNRILIIKNNISENEFSFLSDDEVTILKSLVKTKNNFQGILNDFVQVECDIEESQRFLEEGYDKYFMPLEQMNGIKRVKKNKRTIKKNEEKVEVKKNEEKVVVKKNEEKVVVKKNEEKAEFKKNEGTLEGKQEKEGREKKRKEEKRRRTKERRKEGKKSQEKKRKEIKRKKKKTSK